MPLFPSPEPSVSCIDDFDFFKDFENEFPAIVYNDALTSKLDFSTEPTLCPQHIDEFDLNDETSLFEYDEVEQNIFYFNDLFPFNIIYPDGLKLDKDNDDNEIDMIPSSGGDLAEMMGRRIGDEMGLDVAGLHTAEEMEEDGFGAYWLGSERVILDKGDLSDYWVEISSGRDFLRGAPSYTYIRDLVRRLCHRLISYNISRRGQAPEKVTTTDLFYLRSMDRGAANVPYLLAQYLFRHAEGRKSGARLFKGHFIGSLAITLVCGMMIGLRGLSVWPMIYVDCMVDEGAQADPAPLQAP
ncbi:hypothetical protein Tco_0993404 [Tanacetum coccineum]|uniref:Uncharacterized protein n=1 Tax=Tanacetum coccineum TaxID=301880 RepID=A0ABQ5F634_9ASTR